MNPAVQALNQETAALRLESPGARLIERLERKIMTHTIRTVSSWGVWFFYWANAAVSIGRAPGRN